MTLTAYPVRSLSSRWADRHGWLRGRRHGPVHRKIQPAGPSRRHRTAGYCRPALIVNANDFLAFIGDEFINQALRLVAGLLCQTVVEDGSLPIGINTSLLDIIAPGYFAELFPTTEPLIIETRPAAAPEAYADGPNDINVALDDLGLDFYAGLDGRMTRVVGLDMDSDIGVNTTFDSTTGELGITVALTSDDIDAAVILTIGRERRVRGRHSWPRRYGCR